MTKPLPRALSANTLPRAAGSVERSNTPERSTQPEPFNSFKPMGAHLDALMKKVAPK